MISNSASLDTLCINTIRFLAVDAIQQANSGHPGMPMGSAPMAHVLWSRYLRHNPANPAWPDRDRFVLSAGHGSMLLYSLLHLTGYDLSLDELKNFRQWGSKTPGHPEYGHTPGVETTTGPLGQGVANAVGMAMAEAHLAARYNRPGYEVVNHFTYGIVGDGDLMEGISHEAASLAGHLGLGKLIVFYDDNQISIEGRTDIAFTEDRLKRFEAYGWHTRQVADGNDLTAIDQALAAARAETNRPSLIAVRTLIGFGSPNRQDTAKAHGEPLGPEEIKLTRQNLNWPATPFYVPTEVAEYFSTLAARGRELETAWQAQLAGYRQAYPELAAEFEERLAGRLPANWQRDIPAFSADAKGKATRVTSGLILNGIAKNVPALMGGSADLAPSTMTLIAGEGGFQKNAPDQRNIHFGVREHGMGGILNGMALHGGFIPYGATFLIFSEYMRPAIRLASLMKQRVIYVFTHDSIGLGEDGPTHQPIEQLASLRAIPNLNVIRPCDANECVEAWRQAMLSIETPTVLALTRQAVPTLDRADMAPAGELAKGGYVLKDFGEKSPEVVLIGTGSELHIALAAAETLAGKGIAVRLVSMPCWELFDKQPAAYRESVLPAAITARVAIEAGATLGWHRYVGERGTVIGLDHFGASAPIKDLYRNFGLTSERVVEAAGALLGKNLKN
ncbi:MAG: transketolase [Deltaproteobacteria bacterium RIFOXYD12_FULL_57_12]|nr:MAG: transketolase [Deltaproteobacteria bacterium RIFOXYD12_FULL_57_12]